MSGSFVADMHQILHKGGVFNQLERFDEALQCYEEALRLKPEAGAALMLRRDAVVGDELVLCHVAPLNRMTTKPNERLVCCQRVIWEPLRLRLLTSQGD